MQLWQHWFRDGVNRSPADRNRITRGVRKLFLPFRERAVHPRSAGLMSWIRRADFSPARRNRFRVPQALQSYRNPLQERTGCSAISRWHPLRRNGLWRLVLVIRPRTRKGPVALGEICTGLAGRRDVFVSSKAVTGLYAQKGLPQHVR